MTLKNYLSSLSKAEITEFKQRANISSQVLSHLKNGFRRPGANACVRLIAASDNQLTMEDLRPDLYKGLKKSTAKTGS